MTKEIDPWTGLTGKTAAKKPKLVDRQRRLYAFAEEIQRARDEKKPLRPELANWLAIALKSIACGEDAEECLGVKPNKPGETKGNFLREIRRKNALAYVAAATDKQDGLNMTNDQAFKNAEAFGMKASSVRNDWNSKDADRGPIFTLSEK
jgi:hypothetical protein